MLFFGATGMVIAGVLGIVGSVIFWSVLANRRNVAEAKKGDTCLDVQHVDGVWPPQPKR